MKTPDTADRKEILSYLTRKQECYEKILKLTETQDEVIQSNNTEKLNLITTEKESYINEIKRMDKLNAKAHEALRMSNKNIIQDKQLYSLMNQLQTTIIKIQDYDSDTISQLASSVKNTKNKLGRLNKRMRAQQSMRHQRIHSPRFVDVLQ